MPKTLTDDDYRKMQYSDIPIVGFEYHLEQFTRVHDEDRAKAETAKTDTTEVTSASTAPDISTLTVHDATEYIATVNSVDELKALKKIEKAGKDRVGVIDALDSRIQELS